MKINNTKKLLEKIEGKKSISDKFHNLTVNKKFRAVNVKQIPQAWITINFKTYPRLERIKFENVKINMVEKLTDIFIKRRSIRKFSGLPISKGELYRLLFLSSGITHLDENLDYSKRAYPSAGARYPLEVYPIILNCKEIEKGLYHYNVIENSLEMLLNKDLTKWIVKSTNREEWIKNAAVVFIIAGILNRNRVKYGDRGYRFALIEAGHLGQNISLLATALELGSCALGGFIDSEVNNLLDVVIQEEVALYLIAVGKI